MTPIGVMSQRSLCSDLAARRLPVAAWILLVDLRDLIVFAVPLDALPRSIRTASDVRP